MLAEIEALLIAYGEEQAREQKLVAELLTALANGASDRKKMFSRVAAAAECLGHQTYSNDGTRHEVLSQEISKALEEFRNGRAQVHH